MRHATSLSGTTNALATLAAVSTAGASACAGGVCAIGAQAASVFAASASSAASMASATTGAFSSQGSYPWWQTPVHHAAHLPLPLFTRIALVLLWISAIYTITSLSQQKRRYAWLSAFGAIIVTIAELHWLPGGMPVMFFGVGLGITLLLLSPWLPRWSPRRCASRALRITLFFAPMSAIGLMFYFQIFQSWNPCPLCLTERIFFFFVALFTLFRRPTWAFLAAILSPFPVFLQIIEMSGQSHAARFLSQVCSSAGPSCGSAGAHVFVFPVAYDAAGLSVFLVFLSLLVAAPYWNRVTSHRSPSL